ncbi:MAG: TIGR00645 family protein [Candidatus Marithrix sp.]
MLKNIADFIENLIESILFGSRWLLAPFYLGLVGALVILLVKFVTKFIYIIPTIADASGTELILSILGLIDIVLIANLLLMIILSGYENFVSKIDAIKGHVDRPEWMGKVDYAGLKLKVISSIVAISSIELLKVFIHISEEGDKSLYTGNSLWEIEVFWLIMLHITFVVSGLIFALTERTMHPHNNDH